MSGRAAYKALIKSVSGESVASLGEPAELVGSGITIKGVEDCYAYRVTDPLRRVLDQASGITTHEDGVEVASTDVVFVDWLSGKLYSSRELDLDVTLDISFFTTAEVVGATSYTLDIGGDVLTDTSFKAARENGGYQTRILGLNDVSFSIDRNTDEAKVFLDYKRNRERVLVEVTPGGEDCGPYGGTYRGWFIVESDGYSGDVGDLEAESISFNLDGELDDSFTFIEWEA